MKALRYIILATLIGILLSGVAFSQATGDYRSAATGNWSEVSTWEMFDGANWVAASSAPTGTETITVDGVDSVYVDVAVTISGYVTVTDTALIDTTTGSLTFENESTYEHARDTGSVPTATWEVGSTFLLSGTVQDAPSNRNQDFYHFTFNTPDLGRNRNMSWNGITIGGDITVISTGLNRWQMMSASAGDTSEINIMGDVIVEDGQFTVQGTSTALTTFIIHHYGNIIVTGGNFSISRGSQGSGSGTTTWYLHAGNFSMSNATIQNSNPEPGQAKLVFANNGTQQMTFSNVTLSGDLHFEVSDTTTLQLPEDFIINGLFVNHGVVEPLAGLTVTDGGVYDHARDGGSVPVATWEEGSTALFTGITGSTPSDRGQDYYNLTLNTPDMVSNLDMSLDGNTISGDITLLSSGISRWRLVGGSSGTISIMGDVIVEDGSLETQGTSSPTEVEVLHYGNVNVTGGTFAISRGSQGGVGSTKWYLLDGDFSIADATTRNSNPGGATFVFSKDNGTQNITLVNVDYGSGGLPVEVDSTTTLNMGTTVIEGAGNFVLSADATLATELADGVDGALQTSGEIMLDKKSNFTFNGILAQVPGMLLPDSIGTLTVQNPMGVSFNDTLSSMNLVVSSGSLMQIDTSGSVTADSGTVSGTIVNKGELDAVAALIFEDGSVYDHARNGGDVPTGIWNEGSTLLMSGTVDSAPGNRNQSYYNIIFNTPNMVSNLDMALDDVMIGGDIRVVNTGSARWRLTSASGGDTAIVTIMGDVFVESGSLETQGTSNALTVFEVHHYGDVIVTGGTFAVSRGSQGSGSGSTRWYLHEGNFSIADATTRNSNPTNAWFVFEKDSVQNINLTNVDYGSGGLPIEVVASTTLDFGMSQLAGDGLFILNESATLATANEGGLDSTIQTTGDDSLHEGANYTFNGTTAQVTGTLMPMTVLGLTIDNEAGVVLSQETMINGVLRLVAGVFDNTIPFTLGPDGSISYEGGSLSIPTAIEDQSPEIPKVFALYQNFPNPFNPTTTIRYDVPKQSHVTVEIFDVIGREVARLVNDPHIAGSYAITWNAQGYASGLYYYRITAGDFISVKKLVLMK